MAKRKPASETVIDQVANTPGTAVVEAPAPKSLWQRPAGPVTFDHPTLAEIARLKEEYAPLAAQVETPEGYEAVRKAIRHLVPLRTGVDELRLEAGREARAYVGEVNAAGNLLISKIKEIEEPLVAAKEAVDKAKEREALAKALAIEAEQKRLEDERLAKIKAEEEAKKAAEEARMQADRDEIARQREELRKEQAETQHKADLARQEVQRQLDELREAQAKIDAENRRIEDAKLAAARAEEEAKQKEIREAQEAEAEARRVKEAAAAEQRRLVELEEAKKRAAEEAVAKAEADRITEARRIAEEAERRQKEAAEKAAQAPDKTKILAYFEQIERLPVPEFKTDQADTAFNLYQQAELVARRTCKEWCNSKRK